MEQSISEEGILVVALILFIREDNNEYLISRLLFFSEKTCGQLSQKIVLEGIHPGKLINKAPSRIIFSRDSFTHKLTHTHTHTHIHTHTHTFASHQNLYLPVCL